MSAPDRIWVWENQDGLGASRGWNLETSFDAEEYFRADGPTITAYREALRKMGLDPDSIAREAEKEAQNG